MRAGSRTTAAAPARIRGNDGIRGDVAGKSKILLQSLLDGLLHQMSWQFQISWRFHEKVRAPRCGGTHPWLTIRRRGGLETPVASRAISSALSRVRKLRLACASSGAG